MLLLAFDSGILVSGIFNLTSGGKRVDLLGSGGVARVNEPIWDGEDEREFA